MAKGGEEGINGELTKCAGGAGGRERRKGGRGVREGDAGRSEPREASRTPDIRFLIIRLAGTELRREVARRAD